MKPKFPVSIMIMCKDCGKHFDIVVTREGPQNYYCSSCGKAQVFDLVAFVDGAVEQCYKMLGKRNRR
jgi:hypothetical protein